MMQSTLKSINSVRSANNHFNQFMRSTFACCLLETNCLMFTPSSKEVALHTFPYFYLHISISEFVIPLCCKVSSCKYVKMYNSWLLSHIIIQPLHQLWISNGHIILTASHRTITKKVSTITLHKSVLGKHFGLSILWLWIEQCLGWQGNT